MGGLSLSAVGEIHSPVSCSADADDSTEPYTTERLSRLPGGYAPLTSPFRALDIDFNDPQVTLTKLEITQLVIRLFIMLWELLFTLNGPPQR